MVDSTIFHGADYGSGSDYTVYCKKLANGELMEITKQEFEREQRKAAYWPDNCTAPLVETPHA